MPSPTRPIVLILTLLLCGNQLAMAQHGISHLVAPPDHACTQCLHQPGQKHALPGCHPATTPDALTPTDFSSAVPSWNGARSYSYQSRAPPSFR